jgi:GntR family transcriptional repressor for pyruvate dehydrogenase complex
VGTPTFQPAKPRRAFEEIISQVRGMVRSGELRTGDRLPAERALAEQFEVSRNTVREALRMLEISGLIQLRRGATGGAFIAAADPGRVAASMSDMLELGHFSLSDLRDARGWIESTVIEVACERADDAMLERLEANISHAEALTEAEDWERKALVHVEFHNLLAEATGNPVMVAVMKSLMEVMRDLVLAVGPTEDDVVLRSRRRFMKHLWARDSAKAVKEMQRSLQELHKLWLEADYKGARAARS